MQTLIMSPNQRAMAFVLMLTVVFMVGTVGYALIEGWPVFDAAYMTI